MAKEPAEIDQSFGIIPIWCEANRHKVLLIQHHAGHWGFPKGHADPGESALDAACRELTEETGITEYRVLTERPFWERYTFTKRGQLIGKTVCYFPAIVYSESVLCQASEIRAYAWLSFEEAATQLSFRGGRQVLAQVQQYLEQQPIQPLDSPAE